MLTDRDARLNELSQLVIDGVVTYKLDHIATVSINSRHYFNVFRRYNSVYNIIVEDNNADIYLHQDYTVRKSLQTVMCLPEHEAAHLYTWNATSYKHNGPVPSMSVDIADMRWTELQTNYQAVNVNFGGIFQDPPTYEFDNVDNTEANNVVLVEPPSTPVAQIRSTPTDPPGAPARPPTITDKEAACILLTLSMPPQPRLFMRGESDGPTLSMRFTDVKKRIEGRQSSCYCYMNSDDGEDDGEDDREDDDNRYTVLRSGTQIPKPFTQ